MDNKTIFTETYKVRSTQVNLNNQLGLYGVLGMLQDIAAEQAIVSSYRKAFSGHWCNKNSK